MAGTSLCLELLSLASGLEMVLGWILLYTSSWDYRNDWMNE